MDSGNQAADARARAAALFSSLAKFAVGLRPEQADQIVTGSAKPVMLEPGQRIVEQLVGLDQALKLLRGLSEEDRANLTSKAASLTILRPGHKVQQPLDLDQVVSDVARLAAEEDV